MFHYCYDRATGKVVKIRDAATDASSEGEHRNMVTYRDERLLQTALILLAKGENLCV